MCYIFTSMQKLTILILLFFASLSLQAAPVGNTAAPALIQEGFVIPCTSWVDFRIGYEGDFVGDGRMKQTQEGSGRVDTFQQYTNSGTATLNFLDRLDLFGVFGSSRVCTDWRFNSDAVITRIQLETRYHYLWGLGGRGILIEWGKVAFGLGGRYSFCNYKPSWMTSNGAPVSVEGTHLRWRQWQTDVDLSYQIDLFTPYFGVKYSKNQAKLGVMPIPIAGNGSGSNHFVNRTSVGIFIGCSISNGKYFMLNIEGRLIDEDAVTISGDLRF